MVAKEIIVKCTVARETFQGRVTVPSVLGHLVLEIAWQNGHEHAIIAHQFTFGPKIARVSISPFSVIKIILQVQMFNDIVELK